MRATSLQLVGMLIALSLVGCGSGEDPARPARIAVAANFAATARALAEAHVTAGGAPVDLVIGSTGGLHAQITAGAPFDAFLAADAIRPRRLVTAGLGAAETRFVYAVGRLVLWSATGNLAGDDDPAAVLRRRKSGRIAIADPVTAPYGAAAHAYLEHAGLLDELRERLVTAQSVGQAHQFTASGNAELGFVAASQVGGSVIFIPESTYPPLAQAAVALTDHPGARAFLLFIQDDPAAHAIITGHGYRLPSDETTPHAEHR